MSKYLCKDPNKRKAITNYIEDCAIQSRKTPSQREIAKATGISATMVGRYMQVMREEGVLEYGRGYARTKKLKKINTALQSIRMVGTVTSGVPNEENSEEYEYIPTPRSWLKDNFKYFYIKADGDGMIDVGINDGALVLIRQQNTCEDGDIAIVLVNGCETLLKTIYHNNDGKMVCLHAENSKYPDNMRNRYETNVQILGVAERIIMCLGQGVTLDENELIWTDAQ